MKTTLTPPPAALLLALTLAAAPAAQAAAVLYEQAPLHSADALANGTDGQAPPLAETFSFSGVASTLSWWGTPGEGFDVSLTAGSGTVAAFSRPTVNVEPAGFTVTVDIDGNATEDTVDVYRFSIDLGALSAGTYTLAVREVTTDALGLAWFWLQGAPGDGQSLSGIDDPQTGPAVNPFDLSLRVDGTRGGTVPEPASTLLVAAALGALAARSARRQGRAA